MNQIEFMKELEAELRKKLDAEELGEILSDFEAHFKEAVESGKSEEEVCDLLGEPVEIAEQYCEESAIFETVENQTEENHSADVNITLYSASLVCRTHKNNEFIVEVTHWGREIKDPTISIAKSEGGLEIIHSRPHSFVDRFFEAFEDKKVYVMVPQNFQGKITAKTAHGNLVMDEVVCKDLTIDVISGNVRLTDVRSENEMNISCTSGNVHLNRCQGEADIKGKSGNIHVNTHIGSVSAFCLSGNISAETECIEKDCKIQTRSGNLKLTANEVKGDLDIECHSGNVKLSISHLKGNVAAKTRSGNVKAFFQHDLNAVFSIQSSEIKNEFGSNVIKNSEIPFISLSTRSGNVRVKKL